MKTETSSCPAKRPATAALTAIALSLILAACGGGGGGGGTTTSGTSTSAVQSANGTVTGFGSVFVDGREIEDANASVLSENKDGSTTSVALKLGQRVRVAHDGNGTASSVSVDAAVIGAVSNLEAATNSFKVAGQWVKVNTDSASGPVTAFGGGYTAFADIAAADLVEVHGSAVFSATRAAYEVQATRIEKKSAISAIRVMGKLASLNATAKTFAINGLVVNFGTATLVPATATIANDQVVAVWGEAGSLTTVGGVPTLVAKRIRVMNGALVDSVTSGIAQLGGLVSNYSATAKTLELQGVKVSLASATITPVTRTLGNGSYVHIRGTFGTDGVLVASEVQIREQDTVDDTARIKLNGAIASLTDANSFVVRGVPVDATGAVRSSSCTGVTLAAGVYVKVVATAQVGTDVVKAVSVACVGASVLPAIAMREVQGTASAVDLTAKKFTLTPSSSTTATTGTATTAATTTVAPLSVLWSEQTSFSGVTTATLSGALVKVEGYLNTTGALVAREIRVPGSSESDDYDKSPSDDVSKGWGKYRNGRK